MTRVPSMLYLSVFTYLDLEASQYAEQDIFPRFFLAVDLTAHPIMLLLS